MVAEILCIGTELLIGDIVNTNAAFLSKSLSEHGFDVLYHSVCGDNRERMKSCIKLALERSDVVVSTGGLGPTYDDITMEIFAEAFDLPLYKNTEAENAIIQYFEKMGRTMTDNNLKQAYVPETAVVMINQCGTAPGVIIKKNGKTAVLLPGPPREMKDMFCNQVLPIIAADTGKVLVSSNVNIFGMGESSVENELRDIMVSMKNPTLAPYVNDGEVRIRVTAGAENEQKAKELIAPVVKTVCERLGNCVYGVDCESIQSALVSKLKSYSLTIATAESCTGGLLSAMITDVSGSSDVFGYGVCTYANEAKVNMVGVNQDTLDKYGAVSEQTAMEMASGILKVSGADIAVSLTGIAGPTGGTEDKPVGLVWLGVATKERVYAKKLLLARHNHSDRKYIRTLAAKNAIKAAYDEAERLVKM